MNGARTPPKVRVFDTDVSVCDYDSAADAVMDAAIARRSFGATALAVHGLMTAADDPAFAEAVNALDLVTPDGQPVRWAMNALRNTGLRERVDGPNLMWRLCGDAAAAQVPVYLYGSTSDTVAALRHNLVAAFPGLVIADAQPDRFREGTATEDTADVARINDSGAGVVFVGRGCPRQERWTAAHRGRVHAAMVAVGAAFDYHAGKLDPPPQWVQDRGLQWAYRLAEEPKRLARRYAVTNTRFMARFARELVVARVQRRSR